MYKQSRKASVIIFAVPEQSVPMWHCELKWDLKLRYRSRWHPRQRKNEAVRLFVCLIVCLFEWLFAWFIVCLIARFVTLLEKIKLKKKRRRLPANRSHLGWSPRPARPVSEWVVGEHRRISIYIVITNSLSMRHTWAYLSSSSTDTIDKTAWGRPWYGVLGPKAEFMCA